MGVFAAKVGEWVNACPERASAVFADATQRVVSAAQRPEGAGGNMPVRDGFLRASVVAALGDAMPAATFKPTDGVKYPYDDASVALVIANATVEDRITVAWTANYAGYVHFGAQGRPAKQFLGLAAQRWPQFIEEAAREAEARNG